MFYISFTEPALTGPVLFYIIKETSLFGHYKDILFPLCYIFVKKKLVRPPFEPVLC